ncbi:hypothetical protein ACFL2T_01150 [Elusimicrobiota bacterium]
MRLHFWWCLSLILDLLTEASMLIEWDRLTFRLMALNIDVVDRITMLTMAKHGRTTGRT